MRMPQLLLGLLSLFLTNHLADSCAVQGTDCNCNYAGGSWTIFCRNQKSLPVFVQDNRIYDKVDFSHYSNNITSLPANGFRNLRTKAVDLVSIGDEREHGVLVIHNDAFRGLENDLVDLRLQVRGLAQVPKALQILGNLESLKLRGFSFSGGLPGGVFLSLQSLKKLTMRHCQLRGLDSQTFRGVAENLEELHLTNNQLSALPVDALRDMRNLRVLSVAHNTHHGAFRLPTDGFIQNRKLRTLDLSSTGIAQVQTGALRGLEDTLQHLDLEVNSLTQTHLATLISGLKQLTELKLNENRLQGLENIFMTSLPLTSLSVKRNQISTLASTTFAQLQSLKKLELDENRITSIGPLTFATLLSLTTLTLSSQRLATVLRDNTFTGLERSLQLLDLSSTQITQSALRAVTQLRGLLTLKLSGNMINDIQNNTFLQLSALQKLDLSANQLQDLTPLGIHGTQLSLRVLELSSNELTGLNKCVLHRHAQLRELHLINMQMQCDCRLRWAKEWYDADNANRILDGNCANLNHRSMDSVPAAEYTCTPGSPTPAPCDVIPLPTTEPVRSTTSSASGRLLLELNVTGIGAKSMRVNWIVTGVNAQLVRGFSVSHRAAGGNSEQVANVSADQRSLLLTNLQPDTNYTICVRALYASASADARRSCAYARTHVAPPIPPQGAQAGVVAGAVLGVLLAIALVILAIAFVVRRKRLMEKNNNNSEVKNGGLPQSRSEMPRLGYDSRRYRRERSPPPTSQELRDSTLRGAEGGHDLYLQPRDSKAPMSLDNYSNEELEKKLAGFSEAERQHIRSALESRRAERISGTPSMNSVRYVPEPRRLPPQPREQEGYLNPRALLNDPAYAHNQQQQNPYNPYSEIPDPPRTSVYDLYEEIPAGAIPDDHYV